MVGLAQLLLLYTSEQGLLLTISHGHVELRILIFGYVRIFFFTLLDSVVEDLLLGLC